MKTVSLHQKETDETRGARVLLACSFEQILVDHLADTLLPGCSTFLIKGSYSLEHTNVSWWYW